MKHEGLCLGTSSGINVAGAIEMAKEMGPGNTIVTILCDVGSRSASKIFNVDFLKSKNLPYPDWLFKIWLKKSFVLSFSGLLKN